MLTIILTNYLTLRKPGTRTRWVKKYIIPNNMLTITLTNYLTLRRMGTRQWASKNSQPKCWTRIYPSYLWHFVTPHFTQIFGQELKRSLHKYFGEKQRKIHFQYHIVGPERRYWNWISIHFLPSINHIWPPGANISEKLKYYHDPVCDWRKNISVQRCENWRAAILSGEKVILNWKRVIFSGEKAILSSFLHYQNQQHLETGVYYIQVWSKLFWNRCNTRY